MAVEALCPTCGATFSLRDELQGKKVRCTKCEQVFTVGGDAKAKPAEAKQSVQPKPTAPAGKSAAKDDDDEISTSKKNRPAAKRSRDDDDDEDGDRPRKSASRRGKDDDDDDDKPRAKASSRRGKDDDDDEDDGKAKSKKKRTYHDDDDDDDAPRKPARKSGGGVGLVLGIVGGGLFLVLLICGGISYWIYAGVNSVAEDIKQDMANNGNNGFPVAGDPGFVFDNNKFGKIDDALKGLKSAQATERQSAARWFGRQQAVDKARQDEVAKALEPLLTEPDTNSRFAAMNGLKLWATADNVPALAKALDDGKLDGPADANKDAMAALGRLKDGRGAAAVARYMPNVFIRDAAVDSLKQMGPVAEKAVLKYYFDKDGGAREKARVLVQGYGTKDAAIIAQAVDDVKQGSNRDVRRAAASWLKTARVDPAQQAMAASTLANTLTDTDNDVADAAIDALDTWATAETVPALIRQVEDATNGGRQDNMRRKAIGVLGKLKATQAAPAVAARLPTGDRKSAGDALIAMGPGAKDEVMKYINHANNDVRAEAKRVLASYGNAGNLDLTEKLGDLKGIDKRKQGDAARWFQTAAVDEAKRIEVSKALAALIDGSTDRGVQEQAIKAMGVWGTRDDLASLVKVVEGPDQPANSKNAAIDVLVKLKDERVVKPLAARLLDPRERANAAKNLIALGPDFGVPIENEVAAGLAAQDKALKIECAKILGAVGTKASLTPLNNAAKVALLAKPMQKDVAQQCADAATAITLRGK